MDTQTAVPHIDQAWPRLVTPTQEEIRYAEQLRRQIEERYLKDNSCSDAAERPAGG